MTEETGRVIRECPFCGRAAEMIVGDMLKPSCKCFDGLMRSMCGPYVPMSVWQHRPYVDAQAKRIAELEAVIQPYQELWIKMNRLTPSERKMIEAMVEAAWESAGKP